MNKNDKVYADMLSEAGFLKIKNIAPYNEEGQLYKLSNEYGEGYYWIYEVKDMYVIKIHDFTYSDEYFLNISAADWPHSINLSYFESISGEELNPYRRMSTDFVKLFFGGKDDYRAVIHKGIPVRSIGVEIFPDYYEKYLHETYGDLYENPHDALLGLDKNMRFPELIAVLKQIWYFQGKGISARLFYESKIAETIALIIDYQRSHPDSRKKSISAQDAEYLSAVATYIGDHFQSDLSLDYLATLACMGTTKLKTSFKTLYGCSISEYIKQRRLSQAEAFLSRTDFSIEQIAKTVGYSNPGRFAADFKKSTGYLPSEFKNATSSFANLI